MPSSKRLIDGNRIKKIYPFFRQRPNYDIIGPGGGANIEAAVIDFNNQDQKTYTFIETYTQVPVCIVSPEDTTSSSSANVNLYITSITTTQVTIESSEVFTGKVHLHIHESEA